MQHHGPIAGLAAHGGYLASAGYDNQVILREVASGRALARGCHDHLVNQCAFSPDGRWLVSAGCDGSARVWSVPDMRLQAVLADHEDDVDMALFSPDGTRIATCALDRRVRVFDRAGRCLHVMSGHTGNVLSLAWSADGAVLVSTSVDGTVRCWDAARGGALSTTDLGVRTDSVECAADGTLYAGDDFGRLAIVRAGRAHFVPAHRAGVKKVVLDAERGRLLTLSYDRSFACWQLDASGTPVPLARGPLPADAWARAAAMLPDGRIAVGTFGGRPALFDPADGTWALTGVQAGPGVNAVLRVAGRTWTVGDAGTVRVDGATTAEMGSLCNFLVAAGDAVYTGGQLGQLFDARDGRVLHQHHSPLNCGAAFRRDGRPVLAVGTYTGEILVFDLSVPGTAHLEQALPVYDNAVKGLHASGDVLFSVCASTEIAWHRATDGALLRRRPRAHERIANGCCALGDGRFATISRDRTLRLWDAEGGEPEVYESAHPNSVKCLAVDDDRTLVLTGSYGGTVAAFDLRERRWRALQRPTAAGISSIAWDPDTGRFLAASYDGHVYPIAA